MSGQSFDMEKYTRAAEVFKKVFKESARLINVGAKVIDICERIESELVSRGLSLAFPVNISINDIAAHYTSKTGDQLTIREGDLVKVDIGAHLDGHIIDAAYTVTFDDKWNSLVECAKDAVELAIRMCRPGVRTSEIGSAVERFIKEKGFRPVENLTGHQILPYRLHGKKSVPAVGSSLGAKMEKGEVYAIEIFPTTGRGHVVDTRYGYIFSFNGLRTVKNATAHNIMSYIMRKYPSLPFAERWISKELNINAMPALKLLVNAGAVHEYKVLQEITNAVVSQAEHTIVITDEGAEVIA
ncbi:MAG: type II methionyl aminopeptidase [Candidatus Korarchaeota archaeon]